MAAEPAVFWTLRQEYFGTGHLSPVAVKRPRNLEVSKLGAPAGRVAAGRSAPEPTQDGFTRCDQVCKQLRNGCLSSASTKKSMNHALRAPLGKQAYAEKLFLSAPNET